MNRLTITFAFLQLVALMSLTIIPSNAVASSYYDVSYLWHHDLDRAFDYREQLAPILGPDVASDLKVVSNAKLFGVIYHRRGDSTGARKVARAHSKLLRARGLDAATPLRSVDWTLLDQGKAGRTSTGLAVKANANRRNDGRAAASQTIGDIEKAVERYIKRLRDEGKIASDERTGWSVYDFTTGKKLVTINENAQFQAASLVKPFIAAAFFHKVEQGELVYGKKSRRHMERMIQRSNNRSTNWITRQLGGPQAVERILKRHYPGIFKKTRIVEYIPADGRTYRNEASVRDYSRFLYAVWNEKIPGSREIKRLMSLPGPDRIYTGARKVPVDTKVWNKTGSTARVCADMGILVVEGKNNRRYAYTLIGIIEKKKSAPNYTTWIRSRSNVIRNVSNIVYKGIARYHNLKAVL